MLNWPHLFFKLAVCSRHLPAEPCTLTPSSTSSANGSHCTERVCFDFVLLLCGVASHCSLFLSLSLGSLPSRQPSFFCCHFKPLFALATTISHRAAAAAKGSEGIVHWTFASLQNIDHHHTGRPFDKFQRRPRKKDALHYT